MSEVPTSVAASDTGIIAVGLHDAKTVALVSPSGDTREVDIACSTQDVAIDPAGTTAWAVCQDSTQLIVIDVATGTPSAVDMGAEEPNSVAYLPTRDELVVAALSGSVLVVGQVSSGRYALVRRIATPGQRPSGLAPLPDGSATYVVTDQYSLLRVDLLKGAVTQLTAQGADVFITSAAVAPTGTALYAAGYLRLSADSGQSLLMSLDMRTGRILQRQDIDYSMPGFSTIRLASCYRTLYVATGLRLDVQGQETGIFGVALDSRGRMGERWTIADNLNTGADVSLSADLGRLAVAENSANVLGFITNSQPYPTLTVTGSLAKGRLALTGSAMGLPSGTTVTVYVKDLTKRKSRFVAQSTTASTDAAGAFRWAGRSPSTRVSVYASGGGVVSPTITLGR